MMKNKLIKIILILVALLMLFSNCKVYAGILDHEADRRTEALEDPTEDPSIWDPSVNLDGSEVSLDEPELVEKAGKVLSFINIIGIIVSAIVLVVIGIKYMLGSVEEKAEYKKSLGPYFIGALLIASATTLPNILVSITSGILN